MTVEYCITPEQWFSTRMISQPPSWEILIAKNDLFQNINSSSVEKPVFEPSVIKAVCPWM
jgi:hypothetical protein